MYNPRVFMEKGKKKIEKIGKAAARVFAKIGYLEANLDDIASAAKMSKGGIYHYFSSKEDILFFVLDNYMERVLENLETQLLAIPPEESKIQFIIKRHIELYAGHKEEAKTLLHDSNCLSKKYQKKIAEKQRKYLELVVQTLMEDIGRKGRIKQPEITTLAFLLFGMCNWCYQWYDPKGSIDGDALSRIIWTLFTGGIAAYPTGGVI